VLWERKLDETRDYVTSVINFYMRDWWRDSDVAFCYHPTEERQRVAYSTSR